MQRIIEEPLTNELGNVFIPFFNRMPTSLLIRGLPGAGKTTLALELLKLVKDRYKPLYISTRVSLTRLQIQFPWLKGLMQDDDIFSSSELGNKSEAIDMRLSTAKGTMENVMSALTDSKNRFIILDSWDALAKEASFEERIKMEKTMVTMADANEGFLLFISEEPEKNTLAYVTDAVISLVAEDRQGFTVRKMIIDKLRTLPVKYKTRLYTLEGSRFVLLPPRQVIDTNIEYRCNNNPYKTLGDILTINEGTIMLLELDLDVDINIVNLLIAPIIINTLKRGNPALVINSPDKLYTNTLKYIAPCCSDEELDKLAIFTFINTTSKLQEVSRIVAFDENDIKSNTDKFVDVYKELTNRYGHPAIIAYDVGLRELSHSNDLDKLIGAINAHVKAVRHNGDVLIIISKNNLKTSQYTRSICDIHISIWKENGLPLAIIEKPALGIYSILFDKNNFHTMLDMM